MKPRVYVKTAPLAFILRAVKRAALQAGVSDPFVSDQRAECVLWRHEMMLLASELKHSHAAIGRAIKKDHTTVLHGVKTQRLRLAAKEPRAVEIDRACRAMLRLGGVQMAGAALTETEHEDLAQQVADWFAEEAAEIAAAEEAQKRKEAEEAEAQARAVERFIEMKRLRRLGWSVNSLSRRFGMAPEEIATQIGERIFEKQYAA